MITDLKFALMCQSSSKFVKPKVPPMTVPSPIAHTHQPNQSFHSGDFYNYGHFGSTSSQQRLAAHGEPYCVTNASSCLQHYNGDDDGGGRAGVTGSIVGPNTNKPSRSIISRGTSIKSMIDSDNKMKHRPRAVQYRHFDDCAMMKGPNGPNGHKVNQQHWRNSTRSVHYLPSGGSILRGLTKSPGAGGISGVTKRPFNQMQSNSCSNLVSHDTSSAATIYDNCTVQMMRKTPPATAASTTAGAIRPDSIKRMAIKMQSQSFDDDIVQPRV